MVWTSGTEGVMRLVLGGIRFVRWVAGPGIIILAYFIQIPGKNLPSKSAGRSPSPMESGGSLSSGDD